MKKLGANHENLDHQAYLILKKMITERKLLPGQKVAQEKLAREMGISRTPLISALKFLEHEKLIESKPRRGFFVRLFSRDEMVHIFELREVLEGVAARRAATQATDADLVKLQNFFKQFPAQEKIKDYKAYAAEDRKFHVFMTDIGGKEFLKSILETYNIITYSYQFADSEGLVRDPNETLEEHIILIKAICARDPVAAEAAARSHLSRTIQALQQVE